MNYKIITKIKGSVADSEGHAITDSLREKYSVEDISVGQVFYVDISSEDALRVMCEEVLVNTLTHTYTIEEVHDAH